MKNLLSLFLVLTLFISCDETKKVVDIAGNVQLSGTYTVATLDGEEVTANHPSISFFALDKTVKGNTGCNNFFGKYTLDLYVLSFSEVGATEMACDEPIMSNENKFMNALYNTGSYSIQKNTLKLYSKADRSVLLTATKETSGGN